MCHVNWSFLIALKQNYSEILMFFSLNFIECHLQVLQLTVNKTSLFYGPISQLNRDFTVVLLQCNKKIPMYPTHQYLIFNLKPYHFLILRYQFCEYCKIQHVL